MAMLLLATLLRLLALCSLQCVFARCCFLLELRRCCVSVPLRTMERLGKQLGVLSVKEGPEQLYHSWLMHLIDLVGRRAAAASDCHSLLTGMDLND